MKAFTENNQKVSGGMKTRLMEDLRKPEDWEKVQKERWDKFKSKDLLFAPKMNQKI